MKEPVTKKKSAKKQLFETVYNRLDSALAEYKDFLDEKKITGRLRKASKLIAVRIEKNMKMAEKRQRKLEKKTKEPGEAKEI
jgi:hypothetical protein